MVSASPWILFKNQSNSFLPILCLLNSLSTTSMAIQALRFSFLPMMQPMTLSPQQAMTVSLGNCVMKQLQVKIEYGQASSLPMVSIIHFSSDSLLNSRKVSSYGLKAYIQLLIMGFLIELFRLVFRCIKWIKRLFTGKGEIERAAAANNHRLLEQSIRRSRVLDHVSNRVLIPSYSEQAVDELLALKNITTASSKENVRRNIRSICNVLCAISLVEQARGEKYSSDNPRHQAKLLLLWNTLKPNEKLQQRTSTQWIDIGFQDANPATDFRGAGYLGLINLVEYSKTDAGQECFKTASNKDTHFFYCSAGLFMTILASNLVKSRAVDKLFYAGTNVQSTFQQLYNNLFNLFHQKWKTFTDKSMMSFNHNLKLFQAELKAMPSDRLLYTLG